MSRRYRKPAVLARLGGARHAVIEASAGTGKTYTLEHLVVELLLTRDAGVDQILVVTFTEKATADLVGRVRDKLVELLAPFAEAPPEVPDDECWHIDDAARERLRRALHNFDRANISTIHAFCQRVLTENAFGNRRLFEQRQVDEAAAFSSAFKDVLRAELAVEPFQRAHLAAFLATNPLEQLERLLHEGHRAQAPLVPVYEPAALEAALAGVAALGLTGDELNGLKLSKQGRASKERLRFLVETIDGWRARPDLPSLLRAFDAEDKGQKPSYTVLGYLGESLAGVQGGERLLSAVTALDRALVPLAAAVMQRFLPAVRARLDQKKRQEGLFDFDDMLALVDRGLEGPAGEALVAELRARYRHALIDEFQDTDAVQWRIFERLFRTDEHSLYLIGDPKQAIYGFRGADVQTYLAARETVGRRESLTENFRSTGDAIDACNLIFEQIAAAPFFTGAIDYAQPVTCGRPTLAATGRSGERIVPVTLLEVVPPPGRPLNMFRVKNCLGAAIANEIKHLLADPFSCDGKPVRAKDIFVLTRTLAEGYEIGRALRAAGVPHAFYKQAGLFQSDEAHHVHALLCAIDEPHAQSRRFKAWNTPFFHVSLKELEACHELPGNHPLMERLFRWKALADARDYEQLFARIIEESGVARRALFAGDERSLTNIQHIFELLLEEVSGRRATLRELTLRLSGYLQRTSVPEGEDVNVQRIESERSAVQIMSLHKAKGLEAQVVFLYGGFTRFGNRWVSVYHEGGARLASVGRPRTAEIASAIAREAAEEDQRLLYVGLTRARSKLYLPAFPTWERLNGCYALLNDRLSRIVADGAPPRLFSIEQRLTGVPLGVSRTAAPSGAAAWQPPAELLLPLEDEASPRFAALRQRHAGPEVTSYSRMKQLTAEAWNSDPDTPVAPPLGEDELPGGPASGLFLHEVLEHLEFQHLDAPLEAFARKAEVRALVEAALRRHDREPRHLAESLRLVHTTLTAPVRLGERLLPRGFHAVDKSLREMEFVYPFRGGFIKGIVDFLFEQDGLAYFVDWKSDRLAGWDGPALLQHVEEHYRLQAQIYALAMVKMLGLSDEAAYERRFGGLAYCFLRGMPGAVHFERPAWRDIQAWQTELGT